MSATSKRPTASSELRDWKVWAIAAGTVVALAHALLDAPAGDDGAMTA